MIWEIEIPITDDLSIYTGTFRSLKDFKDISCKFKIVAQRIWKTDTSIGSYFIAEALDGPEQGTKYAYRKGIGSMEDGSSFYE